jgi:hypothetical protein
MVLESFSALESAVTENQKGPFPLNAGKGPFFIFGVYFYFHRHKMP